MSSEMMVVSIVIAAATAAFVIFPFIQRDPDVPATTARSKAGRRRHAYETLVTEKQRVLRSIRDLDLDYDMNKLPMSVYASQRIYLIQLYVAMVRRLDDLEIEMNEQQARVEAAVAAYRKAS
jgi:hypothetical protein